MNEVKHLGLRYQRWNMSIEAKFLIPTSIKIAENIALWGPKNYDMLRPHIIMKKKKLYAKEFYFILNHSIKSFFRPWLYD